MKIGIVIECLGLPLRSALFAASEMGASGVQLNATGDLAPERLTETGRREFKHLLRSHGIEVTALYCPLRSGLDVPERLTERIDRLKAAMSLAFDVGAKCVIVQAGGVPAEAESTRGQMLKESLTALGHHGDRVGAMLALESGLDSGEKLKTYLDAFDTGGLAVNYDPANMMVHGYDAIADVIPLGRLVAHVHARDARPAAVSRSASEVPLGAGAIDWMTFIATLEVIGYTGYMTVDREEGETKAEDVEAGVKFLRRFVR